MALRREGSGYDRGVTVTPPATAGESPGGRVVPAIAAAATLLLLVRHAAGYYPLFDDFAIFGELPRTPLAGLFAEALGGFYRPLGLAVMKAEAALFGLGRPWGIASVSVALHVANALLLALLLRRTGHSEATCRAAGALFLASPWAGEAYFWASAQFDLLATFAVLVALLAVLEASRRTGAGAALTSAVAGLAATAALTSKESGVTVALVALLVVLPVRMREKGRAASLALPVLSLLLPTIVVLAIRSRLLPGLRGPYGEFATLVSGGAGPRNLLSHAEAFLLPPFGAHGPALAGLQLAWGGILLAFVVRAVRRDPSGTALRFLAFLASVAPVVALPTGPESIPSGRLLYLPGMFLVLLLAGGPAAEGRPTRSARAGATAVLTLAVVSVSWQQTLWRSASALCRNVVVAVEPYSSSDRPLFLVGLPLRFEKGPHVLKSYAFRYAFPGKVVPPVRADGVVLGLDPVRLRVVLREPDPFSEGTPRPGDRRLRIPLDDAWLR